MCRPQKPINLDEFRKNHSLGYPDGKLAEKHGVSRSTVVRIRRRLGLPANRPVGGRGPARWKENEPYAKAAHRFLQYTPEIAKEAWRMYRASEITLAKAAVATYLEPAPIRHGTPSPYAHHPERISPGQARKLAEFDFACRWAGVAGVPGVAILDLVYVVDPAERLRLAREAVLSAGYISEDARVDQVRYGVLAPVDPDVILADEEKNVQNCVSWAPAPEPVKRLPKRLYTRILSLSPKGTGKRRNGRIHNIETQINISGLLRI